VAGPLPVETALTALDVLVPVEVVAGDPASTPVADAALDAPDETEVDTPLIPPPALARSRSALAMRGP